MTKVREIMTPGPRTVGSDEPLQKAAEVMAQERVGGLPICGPDGKIKGMITDRDIVVRGLASGKALAEPAGQLNQGEAVTVGADDDIDELLATMTRHGVKRLPVVDGADLVGVVTMGDVAQAMPNPTSGELVEALGVE
ncbi:CBS domain-containing protein [Streptomonospora litoralis]|uniref:Hypoxic response protein 1 n=1 Tax=Streptomonospora litoralis TaxID=2498135 RepID=A0A4V0ZJI4_9ACTN|nr:CBS domain-containing protein [Streptomonospora litoralis]QBI53592.1 Hypoxic response protein 1 [Streptomonospora litoralis]